MFFKNGSITHIGITYSLCGNCKYDPKRMKKYDYLDLKRINCKNCLKSVLLRERELDPKFLIDPKYWDLFLAAGSGIRLLKLHDRCVIESLEDVFYYMIRRSRATYYVDTGRIQCPPAYERSLGDIYATTAYYFPGVSLARVKLSVLKYNSIGGWFCENIRKRIYTIGGHGGHNLLDEFGKKITYRVKHIF